MSGFLLDWEREARTGVAEAVFCEPKTITHVAAILEEAMRLGRRLLLTRLAPAQYEALPERSRAELDFDPLSRTAILGGCVAEEMLMRGVVVVAAGTADLAIAREAARTLAFHGYAAPLVADIGVAGLWRMLERRETLQAARVLIVAAGMEGALFSVVAGLVEAPVIAVPTPVGYGVSAGGQAALSSALASCAPGVLTVNIGNGFGAACAAIKILRHSQRAP